MRVYLESTGCRLNQSEIETMARQLRRAGHTLVGAPDEAELCVVNTCAVTADAVRTSRMLVRRMGRANPAAHVVVTGCYSQLAPEGAAVLPGVTQVIDNHDKDRLVRMILKPELGRAEFDGEPLERSVLPGTLSRTRAFVKIQDGCNNRCAFCVTAIARGPERSRPASEIVREIGSLVDEGYHEAVLTGVHLGAYGRDRGERAGLAELVRRILAETPIARLRLSSLEPWNLSAEFFALWQDRRLCRHLHLPLQSGCDATLRRMARRTSQASFSALVEAAREQIPDLGISTDIIVGFPGETEEEFEESLAFVRAMEFMKLHVFRYSRRPETAAARLPNQVDAGVARARSVQMLALADEAARRFHARFVGRELPVLWEHVADRAQAIVHNTGLADNYIRVELDSPVVLTNTISVVRLLSTTATGMHGEIVRAAQGNMP